MFREAVITTFFPGQGYVGDSITLVGSGLSNVMIVTIARRAAGFRIVSDAMIRAEVPPDGVNTFMIQVQGPGAFYSIGGFTYLGVNPNSGLTSSPY
ncbi:IPT/TIG domain-containing protein [Chitinophaga agrisoli]|nr:IPT/TIG domain-containing protein [Chitinophaga agrisoli]